MVALVTTPRLRLVPRFGPFDLTEFLESGVLATVNERVLWPLGLSLTVDYDPEAKKAVGLFVCQWIYEGGHHRIIDAAEYGVMEERRAAFVAWVEARAASMTVPGEPGTALDPHAPRRLHVV